MRSAMIEVITTGLFTTIQDAGRYGYRKWGVPISGAMDQQSAQLANQLVNNTENEAVMEITLTAPTLKFNIDAIVAITGAGFSPSVNNQPISMNKSFWISKGSILKLGRPSNGVRAYLSVAGGFSVPQVLGSRSFYPNITKNSQVKKGDFLSINNNSHTKNHISNASVKISEKQFSNYKIQVYKGPEFHLLSKEIKEKILSQPFEISNDSNRMGYRLNTSENIFATEILTSAVQPGTVQLTPSGQLIVLMRDCQTTGGYARILQLTDKSINILAQKQTGQAIRFVPKKLPF